ncbi:hypothetical protein SDC9_186807 [bioreactor metagenome]|uniref:Uncharacterized protein n=1 Tax=bioreactor metagenome TaxID=1076179 RepID=A0A645HM18_9ZZZZ
MLDRPGNTKRKINFWRNSFTGLSNLLRMADPAFIYNRSGTGNSSAKQICQLFQLFEFVETTHTATARTNYFSIFDFAHTC